MIKFMRHNRLASPYHDYSELNLQQLSQLSLQKVDPPIADLSDKDLLSMDIDFIMNADYFVCSESVRTQETMLQILNFLGLQKNIIIDSRVNELLFDAKVLVSCSENILGQVRDHLFDFVLGSRAGVESFDSVSERVSSFLKEYDGKKVFVLSHGFLMSLLPLICSQKEGTSVGYDFKRTAYLEVFDIGNQFK